MIQKRKEKRTRLRPEGVFVLEWIGPPAAASSSSSPMKINQAIEKGLKRIDARHQRFFPEYKKGGNLLGNFSAKSVGAPTAISIMPPRSEEHTSELQSQF